MPYSLVYVKELGHVPVICDACVSIIVQELHPSHNRIAERKLWSKLSKALLKSVKKINLGSSVLFAFSITSEINHTFSPIYLPLMNPVCSSLIILVITFLSLFAMHLAANFIVNDQ